MKKYIFIFFIQTFLVFFCFCAGNYETYLKNHYETKIIEDRNTLLEEEINYEKIKITLYYNSCVYTDFRTEDMIKNGAYEIKKTFLYEDLAEITCIKDVIKETPFIEIDSYNESLYRNLIECLCIFEEDQTEIIKFTYSENDNNEFALWNGKLIRRNSTYERFVKELIQLLYK